MASPLDHLKPTDGKKRKKKKPSKRQLKRPQSEFEFVIVNRQILFSTVKQILELGSKDRQNKQIFERESLVLLGIMVDSLVSSQLLEADEESAYFEFAFTLARSDDKATQLEAFDCLRKLMEQMKVGKVGEVESEPRI